MLLKNMYVYLSKQLRKGRVAAETSLEMYSGDDVPQCDTLCSLHPGHQTDWDMGTD